MINELLIGNEKQMFRGVVEATTESGQVFVSAPDGSLTHQLCDFLETGEGASVHLTPGDSVLIWASGINNERPVILGRIGSSPSSPALRRSGEKTPHTLVIDAKDSLTLKCGDGSITIRSDGKVLIRGKELVSHALRTNRIKGGTVSIN